MNINAAILNTAVVRNPEGKQFTVRSPLASFVATGKDRQGALDSFLQMNGAYVFFQQRHVQASRGPGRPSKHYDAQMHIQVQTPIKQRFEAVAEDYNLSQSETIVFLLECLDILKVDFVSKEEMEQAEKRIFQLAGASK